MREENVMRKTAFDFGKRSSLIQTIILAIIALVVPAFIQQLLKISPLASHAITMPSVATVLSGLIFGP